MIWGRQDPHIPREGRERIHAALEDAGTRFPWLEVNGQHAFGRDEGLRYDPELARQRVIEARYEVVIVRDGIPPLYFARRRLENRSPWLDRRVINEHALHSRQRVHRADT